MTNDVEEDLFTWVKSVRASDPDTSVAAAKSMKTAAGQQHVMILNVLSRHRVPMAPEEIGDLLGIPVWRRMCELRNAGHIVRVDKDHVNRSGLNAYRYRLTEQGKPP